MQLSLVSVRPFTYLLVFYHRHIMTNKSAVSYFFLCPTHDDECFQYSFAGITIFALWTKLNFSLFHKVHYD